MADYPVLDGLGNVIIAAANTSGYDESNNPVKQGEMEEYVTEEIAAAIGDIDLTDIENAIAALQALGLAVYRVDDVAISTNATPTVVGVKPAGKRFIQLALTVSIDATGGTFTPDSDDITVLVGTSEGTTTDLYFGFFNNNVVAAGRTAVYGGNAVATGVATLPAAERTIVCQFNNAGITGGGTANGTVCVFGLLIDDVD